MPWPTVESNPGAYGLALVGGLDDPDACYSFNMLRVWRHNDGRVFWGTDSGCSCPMPFEEVNGLDDLELLTADTWPEFEHAVMTHCLPYSPSRTDELAADRTGLLAKVSPLVPRSRT